MLVCVCCVSVFVCIQAHMCVCIVMCAHAHIQIYVTARNKGDDRNAVAQDSSPCVA